MYPEINLIYAWDKMFHQFSTYLRNIIISQINLFPIQCIPHDWWFNFHVHVLTCSQSFIALHIIPSQQSLLHVTITVDGFFTEVFSNCNVVTLKRCWSGTGSNWSHACTDWSYIVWIKIVTFPVLVTGLGLGVTGYVHAVTVLILRGL